MSCSEYDVVYSALNCYAHDKFFYSGDDAV